MFASSSRFRCHSQVVVGHLSLCTFAMSIGKWDTAFGFSFHGANYALGQLVFYVLSNQISVQTDVGAKRSTCLDGWLEARVWVAIQRCVDCP